MDFWLIFMIFCVVFAVVAKILELSGVLSPSAAKEAEEDFALFSDRADLVNDPAYSHIPGNIWHRDSHRD